MTRRSSTPSGESVITRKNRNRRYRSLSSGCGSRRELREAVLRVCDAAERIYIENLHQRIETPSGDPTVRTLVDTINAMIVRLEHGMRKQTVFISDASHEMRTPIAVIKGYAAMVDRWGKTRQDVLQESITAIRNEVDHMEALIAQMMTLLRGDMTGEIAMEDVDLGEVSRDAIRTENVLHNTDQLRLTEHSREIVSGNRNMLLQMLRIFLSNAFKYSPSGGPVTIVVSGDGETSNLSVRDSGIGIDEYDLPFIFERFYRADKSRNNKVPGFGLGLAIAESVVRAHKATVAVYSEPGTGTEFTVSFPKKST